MEIFQIVGLALIAAVLSVLIKGQRPDIAIQISIAAGIIIFLFMVVRISTVIVLLKDLANRVNIDIVYLGTVLKIIGIAYITTFGADVCRDAGEGSIASKIELAGKVMIMILAIPIVTSLLDLIVSIMP
jgi:stage III sporulation protein AD